MKLSEITYNALVDCGCDTGKLAESVNSAVAKREVAKSSISQSKANFRRSESAVISRASLDDREDFALEIMAFDSHMQKAAKNWGLDNWELPPVMRESSKALWPFVGVRTPGAPAVGVNA